jgi:flavin-dependent dehydrogenase
LIKSEHYDVGIIGGGLAGLSLSIQCARAGYKIILFEKEKYPFHKVCGEYISFESWDFLEELGMPLSEMNLPVIHKLLVSAPGGKNIEHMLPLGGFGISRYKLDSMLSDIAKANGVSVLEQCRINEILFDNSKFKIGTVARDVQNSNYTATIAVGAFGKRSNLDVKWNRNFIRNRTDKLNNFIGIKYHIRINWTEDLIALHNFKDGYCGISKIEENKYCLCYLTTAKNLELCNNSIKKMEEVILCKNPHLKKIFSESEKLFDPPVTISQISFDKKTQVEDHVLMIGDAAGMITPLCGNGMSMALHGSKIAFDVITRFLSGQISRNEMEDQYKDTWNKCFGKRLQAGRFIQRFFGNPFLSNLLITSLKPFPGIVNRLVRSTHGQPF